MVTARFEQYDFHVDLVEDLMLELTRAANLIADRVRQHLIRSYRLAKGRLVVEYGPTEDLVFRQVLVQYGTEERDRLCHVVCRNDCTRKCNSSDNGIHYRIVTIGY